MIIPTQYTLGELLTELEKLDQNIMFPVAFNNPHSYRGDYMDCAFEPAEYLRVAEMTRCVREAIGSTYQGCKGGEYTMNEYTYCWLSEYGRGGGETIGNTMLRLMEIVAGWWEHPS